MIQRIRKCLTLIRFICKGTDSVRWVDRLRISIRIQWALMKNKGHSTTSLAEKLVLISSVLDIPRQVPGAIAEFGCYKGLSSVALSIAAKYAGRKLLLFDSFEGLPEPGQAITHITDDKTTVYKKETWQRV